MNEKEENRAKLDMEIEKALFKFTNKIKENVYDFVMMTVKRDPLLSQSIDDKTLKTIIELAQTCIQQGKGLFIDEFNQQIKSALDMYVGAENPTLTALTEMPQVTATHQEKSLSGSNVNPNLQPLPRVIKPKISIGLPQE